MNILDDIYMGNTLRSWAIAAGTVILIQGVLLLAKRIIVGRLRKLALKTKTDIDDLVVDLLGRTKFVFLLAIALYAGAHTLTMTDQMYAILRIVFIMALLLQGGIWGNGLIGYGITRTTRQRLGEDAASATTLTVLGWTGKLLLWVVVLLVALDNLGFNVSTLIAGLGVTGIAVALALQNILGDLFASLSIVLDKPFVMGDFIIADATTGTVEHVGLKSTRIRSLAGEQVIIANTDLLKSRIRNFKRMEQRRILFSIGVTYQTPAETLARIPGMIREIVTAQENARVDRAHFQGFGDSALMYEVVYYVASNDYIQYMDIQQNINLALVRRFEAEGIEFAYPTRTLYVKQ